MKRIMILGASILQLPAIRKAKEMGIQVIAVDMNPNAIGFKESDVICETISTIDTDGVLKAARKYAIDGIMTLASDMPMSTVAAVASELGLVGVSKRTALNATNKAEMRKCFEMHDVPIPEYYRVNDMEEYLHAVKHFTQKCIVKPADNSGSRGVILLSNLQDSEYVQNAYHYSKQFSKDGVLVVEEYMEGPEVSVETLSLDGKCHVIQITDKITTGAPYFVEMGHTQPSGLSEKIKSQIEKVTIAAVQAVGIQDGPSHTEIIVTADGPKIVELGARLGGDNITTHLVPLSTGVNMVECSIRIALNEKLDLNRVWDKGAAIRYFQTGIGKIKSITGVESAGTLEGIKQISIVHGIGDCAAEIRSSVDRVGFVIAQGENAEMAVSRCERAMRLINIEVEDENSDSDPNPIR